MKTVELPEKIAQTLNQVEQDSGVLDESAIQTTLDIITADPAFNTIMEKTLENFDLQAYLKPCAKPVASVKERLRKSSKDHKGMSPSYYHS